MAEFRDAEGLLIRWFQATVTGRTTEVRKPIVFGLFGKTKYIVAYHIDGLQPGHLTRSVEYAEYCNCTEGSIWCFPYTPYSEEEDNDAYAWIPYVGYGPLPPLPNLD